MKADDAIKRLEEMDKQLIDGKVRIFKQIADCMKSMKNALDEEGGCSPSYPEATGEW